MDELTILDYFAAKAMQTFVAGNHPSDKMSDREIAFCSYEMAEAMIWERDSRMDRTERKKKITESM